MNFEVLWLFFQFLIFCKIKHSYYRGWEAKQNRIKFFPNITKPGLHFNNWQPLELPFVGCFSTCRGMGYLCIFNFSVRRNRCKRPLQEIPCEGRECSTEHSLLCHSMKRQFTGTHRGGLGKQSASSHPCKSKRHIDNIYHPIATTELFWQREVPSSCWNCFIHGWWSQSLLTFGIIQAQ